MYAADKGNFMVEAAINQTEIGVTALFGPSGAGKTSIINMLAGLLRPDAGYIVVNGRCLFDAAKGIDLPTHLRRIGYVFQDGRLLPHLSVRANLNFGLRLTPGQDGATSPSMQWSICSASATFWSANRPSSQGGEKQRVAIGRALLTSPELLLMDEPLASLDNSRKVEVLPSP
jgi:molybdate transport system ATP-binding protein